MPSALLIGDNGAGKSTIGKVLEILQSIGRGINRVGELVQPKDVTQNRYNVPIRFEIEVLLEDKLYQYVLALILPDNFKELKISEEKLLVTGEQIYSRQEAQVNLYKSPLQKREAQFLVDWHLIALPIIQQESMTDPLGIFKTWLSKILILAPIPSLMSGDSDQETLKPNRDASNIGGWISGLLSPYPAAYVSIYEYLKQVIPDIKNFSNEIMSKNFKSMVVSFQANNATLTIPFQDLSDGEKCFFVCAILLAANEHYGSLFCFWDEPDNYVTISEVGHFVVSLIQSFEKGGQILMTSHNSEAIRKFGDENTFVLHRKSHLEPTLVRLLSDISVKGDLVNTLIRGDLEL
jgi:ABC-type Mn2+/Zn2+ transport system ATPase subunit